MLKDILEQVLSQKIFQRKHKMSFHYQIAFLHHNDTSGLRSSIGFEQSPLFKIFGVNYSNNCSSFGFKGYKYSDSLSDSKEQGWSC